MSNRYLAIGTVIVLVAIVMVGFLADAYLMLIGINPIAAIAAIAVAVIGIAWFRKTVKP